MESAGILGNVSPDRAGDLARRIWRVIKTSCFDRARDREIGHARLGYDATVLDVDVENAVHAPEPQKDAVGKRQGAARKRSARAARDDRHALLRGKSEDLGNLLAVFRQHTDQRLLPVCGQGVAVEGRKPGLVGDDPVGHDPP